MANALEILYLESRKRKSSEQESDDDQIVSPIPIPFDIDELPNIAPLRDHLETVTIKRKAVGKLGKIYHAYALTTEAKLYSAIPSYLQS